jgi:hemolysin activation/secretion protein
MAVFAAASSHGEELGARQAVAHSEATPAPESPHGGEVPAARRMFIREFRVLGAKTLPRIEVEEAVYPFLGPGRTFDDVENARSALEKAYHEKGFKATQIIIPEQTGRGGVVMLQAYEGKVATLRVTGARYFLPSRMKQQAPSLAVGRVINFNEVSREIVALSQGADRRVEPKLTPTDAPGEFDIDLNVTDSLPLHGRAEINNRQSPNTTALRIDGSASFGNLWQRGHSIGSSFQVSPENVAEVKVFSGFYIWRFADPDWLSLLLTGTKQNSAVSTLGGAASLGQGSIIGMRALMTLPGRESFFHSLSVGMDYKHFNNALVAGQTSDVTPITYYPLSASWDGAWIHRKDRKLVGTTELNAGVTAQIRGLGSSIASLDRNRYGSDGNFFYFRGELAHTHVLPRGWELYGKVGGQLSDQPLVTSEQAAGGGMGTARGYLEGEVVGDNSIFGTVEVRTPSLFPATKKSADGPASESKTGHEWRCYGFFDAGTVTLRQPLPEQIASYKLASIGIGTELQLNNHFHGLVELALPLTTLPYTRVHEARVNFRLWADF